MSGCVEEMMVLLQTDESKMTDETKCKATSEDGKQQQRANKSHFTRYFKRKPSSDPVENCEYIED